MKRLNSFLCFYLIIQTCSAQLQWQNVDSAYSPLPSSVHVYFTEQAIDTAPFRAFYLIADLKDKHLDFTTDTTLNRRITPSQFYERNDKPLAVVNGTFFSYETNRSLNVVVKDGKLVSYNVHSVPGKGKDTLTYKHPYTSAIGINKKREADIAWIVTDSVEKYPFATQAPMMPLEDSISNHTVEYYRYAGPYVHGFIPWFYKWKMKTAIGGGPSLLWRGQVHISNDAELKFTGKAINDKHPRTAMGYTADNKLIILMIEGRNKIAHGATLTQEAQILKDLDCVEALNLDGGGSSCLLVNGKETITVSDAAGQRPVPAVFIIQSKR